MLLIHAKDHIMLYCAATEAAEDYLHVRTRKTEIDCSEIQAETEGVPNGPLLLLWR